MGVPEKGGPLFEVEPGGKPFLVINLAESAELDIRSFDDAASAMSRQNVGGDGFRSFLKYAVKADSDGDLMYVFSYSEETADFIKRLKLVDLRSVGLVSLEADTNDLVLRRKIHGGWAVPGLLSITASNWYKKNVMARLLAGHFTIE